MTFNRKIRSVLLAATGAMLLAGPACGGGEEGGPGTDDSVGDDGTDGTTPDQWQQELDKRTINYGQALRIATLKLRGGLPTVAELEAVDSGGKATYEAAIDDLLADTVNFNREIRSFFRDAFKMGGTGLDSAPNFAAMLVANEGNFNDLFTAAAGNCPTFDAATGVFTAGDCASGAPANSGILTNPDVMRQYFSNMAFRRVRFLQETFACTKFPAEVTTPQDVGGAAQYTGPWDFSSTGSPTTGGSIDFHDVSAVVCNNCHVTMNHVAPLLAHFNMAGQYQAGYAVPTPADGMPMVKEEDYLIAGEKYAWRFGVETPDLPALGAAMAADPATAECSVARVWNWAFGKGDIVASLAIVPATVIESQIALFKTTNYNLKEVIRSVFTSDDFVKF
jgi:hypothetical protein